MISIFSLDRIEIGEYTYQRLIWLSKCRKRGPLSLIEKYLESSIESKCQLVVLFFKTSYLPITEVAEKTGLTFLQLNHYCEELNAFFPGSLSMTIQKRMISCQFTHPFKETYLYQLYASSNVLQLLAFLIKMVPTLVPLRILQEVIFYQTPQLIGCAKH